jgi:hypothetical protein
MHLSQRLSEFTVGHLTEFLWVAAMLFVTTSTTVLAQSSELRIDWFTVDAGGGTSTGGNYSVSGTVAQVDADPLHPASGGNFELTGGFWVIDSAPPTTQDAIFRDGFE